jgi:molybdopterin molybdotransferase
LGLGSIKAIPAPRIAILSTGDELVPPGQPLQPGEIYNSNAPMLAALCTAAGAPDTREIHVRDSRDAVTRAVDEAMAECDFLLISGGVSVGDHDHVRPALVAAGAEPDFWRVRVKPGKPFVFARSGRCHVFGLPGNPVSSYVSFVLFALPALRRWMGALPAACAPDFIPLRLAAPVKNSGDRPHYLRGRIEGGAFRPIGAQASHALFGLSRASALARLPEGAVLGEGDRVDVIAGI